MALTDKNTSVQLISLGCAKNTVDSEEILGLLARAGCQVRNAGDAADVVILNTCGFIEAAKQESVDRILEALERKRKGEVGRVVVAGCLAQRYAEELAREMPEIDAVLGTGRMADVPAVVLGHAEADRGALPTVPLYVSERPHHAWVDSRVRLRSTAPWTAYLKISEGCDHQCTFCAIPSFRGPHVSKPMEQVLDEARWLADQGVREINLIAQDTTQYGFDLEGRCLLPELLEALAGIEPVRWIRLFYCYPSRVNERLIEAIANTPKVCQYIDMPLQHADPGVLRAMRRPMDGDAYLRLLDRFRAASPEVAIRTTLIVGFPGETEPAFENLLRFVEKAAFDRLGVFEYSPEEGTAAFAMPGRVPARVKRARRARLMEAQQRISLDRHRTLIGREMEVLVETPAQRSGANGHARDRRQLQSDNAALRNLARGRTYRDAPEIDGQVYLTSCSAEPGTFVRARVTRALPYDLVAEVLPTGL